MLTQLPTVKSRLGIDDFEVKYDVLLTNAITAISSRFDNETNRTLSRTTSRRATRLSLHSGPETC